MPRPIEAGSAVTTTPGITPVMAVVSTPVPTGTVDTLLEPLGNIAYQGILEDPVMLAGGYFEGEPFVAGSASRPTVQLLPGPVALGDLNDDG